VSSPDPLDSSKHLDAATRRLRDATVRVRALEGLDEGIQGLIARMGELSEDESSRADSLTEQLNLDLEAVKRSAMEGQRHVLEAQARADADRIQRERTAIEIARATLGAVQSMREIAVVSAQATEAREAVAVEREKLSAQREATMVRLTVAVTWLTVVIAFATIATLVVTIVK